MAQRIYVASSWRNAHQPKVVAALQGIYDVYDFKNPAPGNHGFSWSQIDPDWQSWTPYQYASALGHPIAKAGFACDMEALRGADLCVLVLPSGRSASWEYGHWCGRTGKAGVVYMPEACEPELMYSGSRFAVTLVDLMYQVQQALA